MFRTDTTRRWFVEIIEAEGHCQVQFGYRLGQAPAVIWQSMPWQLPVTYYQEHELRAEIMDALLVLQERAM